MGVVVVEFESDGDTAVFSDFARRMGAKVDFRFGGGWAGSIGVACEGLCGCGGGKKACEGGCKKGAMAERSGRFIEKFIKKEK